ncbi:MAG: conjugal transfer protein TraW [Candidatus Tisiphia sp.]
MQRKNNLLLIICLAFSHVTIAKDFGKQAATFEIKEEGFVSMMQRKLQSLNLAEHQQKMQDLARKKIEEPAAIVGISKATKTISYSFDPSYVLDQDVVLPCGKLLYARGTKVNPLDYMSWDGKLIFIDGQDASQIAWVKDNYLEEILSNSRAVVEDNLSELNKEHVKNAGNASNSDGTKIVLTGGRLLELEREIGSPIYFDQAGELTTKFNISYVPAIVEQEGKYLKITEINISNSR